MPLDQRSAPQPAGEGEDNTQKAAKLAAEHVVDAVEVIASILNAPGRNATAQLAAARLILELAAQLAPQPASDRPVGKIYALDTAKAAAELAKRLSGKQ
jgi:hypothetical protein